MADYIIHDTTLQAIGNAIRTKTGSVATMTPSEMATAISNIPSGGYTFELIADDVLGEYVYVIRLKDTNISGIYVEVQDSITSGTISLNTELLYEFSSVPFDYDFSSTLIEGENLAEATVIYNGQTYTCSWTITYSPEPEEEEEPEPEPEE